MSNYCHFVGFDNCKFSDPKKFKGNNWVSVNYFLCDYDDPNFCIITDIPKGYRLPTKSEFENLVKEYPFYMKKEMDTIRGKYYRVYWNGARQKKDEIDYKLPVYTFKNELGLEVSVHTWGNGWRGFHYGPICLTKEGYNDDIKEFNKPDTNNNGQRIYNSFKDGHRSWQSEKCYDIAEKQFYKGFDYRCPRCMILIEKK